MSHTPAAPTPVDLGSSDLCRRLGIESPGADVVAEVLAEVGIHRCGTRRGYSVYPVVEVDAQRDLILGKLINRRRDARAQPAPIAPTQSALELAPSPATLEHCRGELTELYNSLAAIEHRLAATKEGVWTVRNLLAR